MKWPFLSLPARIRRFLRKTPPESRRSQRFEECFRSCAHALQGLSSACAAGFQTLKVAGGAVSESLSWANAQHEAGEWIGQLHLPRDLTGRDLDFSHVPLPFDGKFRSMVLVAIKRKLKKRGARSVVLPPEIP